MSLHVLRKWPLILTTSWAHCRRSAWWSTGKESTLYWKNRWVLIVSFLHSMRSSSSMKASFECNGAKVTLIMSTTSSLILIELVFCALSAISRRNIFFVARHRRSTHLYVFAINIHLIKNDCKLQSYTMRVTQIGKQREVIKFFTSSNNQQPTSFALPSFFIHDLLQIWKLHVTWSFRRNQFSFSLSPYAPCTRRSLIPHEQHHHRRRRFFHRQVAICSALGAESFQ